MNSKIRIKLGLIEVEYEGSEVFIKKELLGFIKAVAELHKVSHKEIGKTNIDKAVQELHEEKEDSQMLGMSTQTLASKLLSKTGPDLIIAASAKLTFSDKKKSFKRQDIIDEMKLATAYYKKNYLNNLTVLLRNLIKSGILNELSPDTYALSAKKKKEIETKIDQ